ncbi:unnamed protein product [Pedinophyceae sp. YPF-701]|nr:unnamed protein product [Pedinophyceae sp. YPF-701]
MPFKTELVPQGPQKDASCCRPYFWRQVIAQELGTDGHMWHEVIIVFALMSGLAGMWLKTRPPGWLAVFLMFSAAFQAPHNESWTTIYTAMAFSVTALLAGYTPPSAAPAPAGAS